VKSKNMQSKKINSISSFRNAFYFCLFTFAFLFSGCGDKNAIPKTEPFYGETKIPIKQEFRWSNGKLPTTIDPAFASASPETDVVRAVFDCLTELDAKTLKTQKSLAIDWKSSEDFKTWTFQIRKDAKWSNGESVTAKDFVRSWKRLATLGEKVSHRILLKNIVGAEVSKINEDRDVFVEESESRQLEQRDSSVKIPELNSDKKTKFGVESIGNFTLKVLLVEPDNNFPALVANPMFAAVYDENEFYANKLNAGITTNGAFRINSIGNDGITLDRSANYWNKENVTLTRVKFIPMETAENALQAYKTGDIDALTNFHFEPLALKLLKPFDEFHRTKHSAINVYEFNLHRKPFDDVRVREALAISIDRERLTEDEMDGATEPAFAFSLFNSSRPFRQNVEKARKLFSAASFENGENFPVIRLIVNRNDMQKRVAKAIAAMWKKNLNIDTEIIVKENADFETAKNTGEFDLIRRGVVLPTTNESANMPAIFPLKIQPEKTAEPIEVANSNTANSNVNAANTTDTNSNIIANVNVNSNLLENIQVETEETVEIKPILNEAQAIAEIPSIPLYYPKSYSLVKPYIQGFETNVLDAPSLKTVKIDENWQPNQQATKTVQSVF
jgi:oligopeptide transport system substrate-binding protein